MTLIDRINEGQCSVDELEHLLNEKNPIILYHTMMAIGNFNIYNEKIIEKLYSLTGRRENKDKLLGYYKTGDLAIVTLKKIGINIIEIPSYQKLDEFDRKMIFQLVKEIGWQ